jgi:hypothetical protein
MTMSNNALAELRIAAKALMTEEFRAGTEDVDFSTFEEAFPREVSLAPIALLLKEAMARFEGESPAKSDRWLGPRVHAGLRLTRQEASRQGVWSFLGATVAREYTIWRFKGKPDDPEAPPGLDRFAGPDYKQAIARLWWMAELFRNGDDYRPAEQALSNQDATNYLFRLNVAHHRPSALAAIQVLFPQGGDAKTGREANALAKAINASAATVLIDATAPDVAVPIDVHARKEWIDAADDYDPSKFFDDLPPAPSDPPVPAESLAASEKLLTELFKEAKVRGKDDDADEDDAGTSTADE